MGDTRRQETPGASNGYNKTRERLTEHVEDGLIGDENTVRKLPVHGKSRMSNEELKNASHRGLQENELQKPELPVQTQSEVGINASGGNNEKSAEE